MMREIVRRLLATIPVMGVVAIAVFALLHVTPGDPAAIIAGDYATSDDIARVRTKLGLDKPFATQVGIWLGGIENPDTAKSITLRSSQEPRRQAASTPTGTPTRMLMSIASSVSEIVASARCLMSVVTGRPE